MTFFIKRAQRICAVCNDGLAALQIIGRTLATVVACLVLTGAISMSSVFLHTARAGATNDYPDSDAVDCSAQYGQYSWCKNGSQYSSRGYGYRNCTDWAAWRAAKLTDKSVPGGLGNANTWDNNAPSAWGSSSIPEEGDIAQSDGGSWGHVGVVETVNKDSSGKITSVIISQYNELGTGAYSAPSYSPDSNGVYWRNSAHTMKWDHFYDLNGVGTGVSGSNTSPTGNNTVLRVIKRNQSDGTNLVYWAKGGSVFEDWWRPGGDGVHISNLIDITQQDIKDIDVQINNDGEHLVYTATSHYIWETWYYPGQGKHTSNIIADSANIKKIQKTIGPDGSQQLYVMTDSGVDEYWWFPNGAIHKNRIYTLANPVAMKKVLQADGTQELYVADQGYVYRNWWGSDGVIHTGQQIMHIAQNDITSLDFSQDADGKRRIYAGRRQSGVWEASWYPNQSISTWQVTGDNGVIAIQKYMDGNTHVLYLATTGGVFEYWWQPGTTTVHGSVITAQADVHDFNRATTTDGAQAVYTAANTDVFESYWFPGGDGIHTKVLK